MPLSRSLQAGLFLLFVSFPIWAQQGSSQDRLRPNEMPAPTRDAQAVNILNRAIALAGGMETLAAVRDYKATGSVTRHQEGRDIQGLVTISGSGVGQFRLDENLSTGMRSESTDLGRTKIREDGGTIKKALGSTPFMPGNFSLPHRQLVTLLKDTKLDLTNKGLVEIDGRTAYDIRAQRLVPRALDPSGNNSVYRTKDFFIDAATFQVVMVQDADPVSGQRRIRYSDYRTIQGIPVPFSITEETHGAISRTIRLDNINLNAGLQKSAFDLSAR